MPGAIVVELRKCFGPWLWLFFGAVLVLQIPIISAKPVFRSVGAVQPKRVTVKHLEAFSSRHQAQGIKGEFTRKTNHLLDGLGQL